MLRSQQHTWLTCRLKSLLALTSTDGAHQQICTELLLLTSLSTPAGCRRSAMRQTSRGPNSHSERTRLPTTNHDSSSRSRNQKPNVAASGTRLFLKAPPADLTCDCDLMCSIC
ncbi:hypothetical protein B0T25DRAFT_89340 [Lasiosphaeria hispida]|uniref:Uncharacterized protein n=1 Tax=Lasiosphaeria hispida TaxID=260671 RepID=A0AAJ0HQA2_9PEZI|nr:hypothetical protein B0T25DRAFT_89340 [Lasiosphaeria hispida]